MTLLHRSQQLYAQSQDRTSQRPNPAGKQDDIHKSPPQYVYQPTPKRYRLSEKNLQKHQKALKRRRSEQSIGKPRKMPSASNNTTTATTTDKLFATRLAENRVLYEPFDAEAPDDAESLKVSLLEKQEIPVWTHNQWERMKILKREGAHNELSLESMIVESMLIRHGHDAPIGYNRFRHQQWTEVDNEVTEGISDPKPCVTEAYVWSAYPKGTREDFEELNVSQYPYAMPTFAIESKGPSADPEEAIRQAAYDSAVMTQAAIAIEDHLGKTDLLYRKTKAITVTLMPSEINVYANHAIEEQSKKQRYYHQYQLLRVAYPSSEEEWNKAHIVLYNAQRLALGLANTRIDDLRTYFDNKAIEQEKLKIKQAVLQQQAQVKTLEAISQLHTQKAPKGNSVESKPRTKGSQTPNSLV